MESEKMKTCWLSFKEIGKLSGKMEDSGELGKVLTGSLITFHYERIHQKIENNVTNNSAPTTN